MKLKTGSNLSGIAFAVLVLFLLYFCGPSICRFLSGSNVLDAKNLFYSRILFWLGLLLILLYAVKVERSRLLILPEQRLSLVTWLLSLVGLFVACFIGMLIIQLLLHGANGHSDIQDRLVGIFRHNIPLLVFTCITAGIAEELIFRGYLLPRLEQVFKNGHVAVFISSALFGLIHYKFGTIFHMAGPFVIGILYAYHYRKYRNIKILILSHFLWDMMALLVLVNKH